MSAVYRIENTVEDHTSVLKNAVSAWGEKQPDIYLVSKEGVKVYTQRVLLTFYSQYINELIDSLPLKEEIIGINVPASSSSVTLMLKVLVSGSVLSNNKENLLEVGLAADSLGIEMNNRQIGYRKSDNSKSTTQNRSFKQVTTNFTSRKIALPKSQDQRPTIKKEFLPEEIKIPGIVANSESCYQCGESFRSKEKLRQHLKLHKEEKVKPFACDVCEKSFSVPSSLKSHKLIHSGERLKCEFCDYSAVQKGNLKTHKLKVHKDKLEGINEEPSIESLVLNNSIGQEDAISIETHDEQGGNVGMEQPETGGSDDQEIEI